ncbi:MAG: hypothetical protein RL660_2145 [Bacteroidota bacterium]|jgi:predicted AlkP superfamily pyrophosphatase or phosphodiesterase
MLGLQIAKHYSRNNLQFCSAMTKALITLLLACISSLAIAQTAKTKVPTTTKPKLIVGIVIDQMRYDYLYKFSKNFGDGGFKRLMNGGFNCENTYLGYIPSVTGCGHAGIYTGSVPALHGIASNDWYDRTTKRSMYCTQDDKENTVGTVGKSGKMSPRNLLSTTITDELRLATNKRSKVIGISLKDRGSILPAGHMANAAYWMDDSLGYFITSTYYMSTLPDWVQQFNAQNNARRLLDKNWTLSLDASKYYSSTADETKYEGKYKIDSNVSFPHYTTRLSKGADIKRTPYGNDIALSFAMDAILGEKLGQSGETDFLALSLSSTDYVGHQFGIDALEIEDMYIKLDKAMATFLSFLDKQYGAGNYTIFLTADHGAAHNPTFLKDQKVPAGFFYVGEAKKEINAMAKKQFGYNIVVEIGDNMIWLNDSVEHSVAQEFVCDYMRKQNQIQYVIPFDGIRNSQIPEAILKPAINGYNSQRSGDILFILKPGFIDGYAANVTTGTTHGTWNPYDMHIPMLWYGFGINKGNSFNRYYMHDIASTVAALLKIQVPNANIGNPMIEVLRK